MAYNPETQVRNDFNSVYTAALSKVPGLTMEYKTLDECNVFNSGKVELEGH